MSLWTMAATAATLAALGLWVFFAHRRLVASRFEVSQAFVELHDELSRRHELMANLIDRASTVAAADPQVKLVGPIEALDAARKAVHFARFAPLDDRRVGLVDRAEVANSRRLTRLIAALDRSPACRADAHLRWLCGQIAHNSAGVALTTQTFNRAVFECNRVMRAWPECIVSYLMRWRSPTVVSPTIADPQPTAPIADQVVKPVRPVFMAAGAEPLRHGA